MKARLVIPEILDSLPSDDPLAIRSRRDLVLINRMMGNYGWVAREIERTPRDQVSEWVEIGAGDGRLSSVLSRSGLEPLSITGMDFLPRPKSWPEHWRWQQGNIFDGLGEISDRDRGLVANLFLHHFDAEDLHLLGKVIDRECSRLIFSEPARYRFFHAASHLFDPFVNGVTRHDMRVSIGAGFRKGELASALGLSEEWIVEESTTILGAYRLQAWRQKDMKSQS